MVGFDGPAGKGEEDERADQCVGGGEVVRVGAQFGVRGEALGCC